MAANIINQHDFTNTHQNQQWVTKNGRILAISEMETDHIYNAMGMLMDGVEMLKLHADAKMAMARDPQGDMASLAWEHEQDVQLDMDSIDWLKQTALYQALEEELAKRGEIVR